MLVVRNFLCSLVATSTARVTSAVAIAALLALLGGEGAAQKLGGPKHPVLDPIVNVLDAKGIDVVTSWGGPSEHRRGRRWLC